MKTELKKYFKKIGTKGGLNRMASMTEDERKAFARKGVKARLENKLKKRLDKAALLCYTDGEVKDKGGNSHDH